MSAYKIKAVGGGDRAPRGNGVANTERTAKSGIEHVSGSVGLRRITPCPHINPFELEIERQGAPVLGRQHVMVVVVVVVVIVVVGM